MALSDTQIQQLYTAYLGRPADREGLEYWQDQNVSESELRANLANDNQPEYVALYGDRTREELVTAVYQNMFGREPEAEGLDYWVNGGGASVPASELQQLFINAASPADRAAFDAQVAEDLENVPDPGVPGDTFSLTASTDRFINDDAGTADNDSYEAYLSQNPMAGGVSNTLSSADRIDGGAGDDSLYAEVVPEFFGVTGGNQIDIQPTITNVENIEFEARDLGGNTASGGGTVTVDAKNIQGVNTIGSTQSDGDLVIENLTTLDSNGNARNTEDMTISMDHTDNFNSDGDASDLTVYFDEDYLLSGETTSVSQANYWLLDEDSADYINAPLLNVERNGVSLEIDGTPVVIEMDAAVAAAADTWVSYGAALQARIDEMVANGNTALEDITVEVDENNLDSTFNDDGIEVDIPAITLIDARGRDLVPTGFVTPENATGQFDIYGNFDNVVSEQTQNPVTVNADLHKVGREGEGGNLIIGGKSQDEGEGEGIEVFNIDVLGEDDKPSNLGQIASTNGALRTVNIATAAEFVASETHASLTVRGEGVTPFGGTVDMINATEFLGDLTIGNETAAQDVNTLNATGGGDVEFNASITSEGVYNYTTGAGEDTVDVSLNTDAIDTIGTSLSINTGSAADQITLTTDTENASQQTMAELDNVSINAGEGNDSVNVNGNVLTDITAGAGNDYVVINADTASGSNGAWTFGQNSGPQNFGERVLYQAELTVTFAGFESTVSVPTDAEGNFVATQLEINEAIIDAIDSHADLARLLSTGEGEAARELTVTSLVQGENDLSIEIEQPTVVASNPTAGQVAVGGNDVSDLVQGLIDTTTLDSSNFTNGATDVAAEFGNLNYNGNVDANGGTTATPYQNFSAGTDFASADGTGSVNFSVINMGTGAEDLLVLDDNENSSNVLEVDGAFGHVSVVNFHDTSPNDLSGNKNNVGLHALDFTALLDNEEDPSTSTTNTQSATDINVTLRDGNNQLSNPTAQNTSNATANSVNMARFDTAGNTTNITFDSLTAADLVSEMNGNNANSAFDQNLEAQAFGTTLIGDTQKHIVMIENDQNLGEYKVFYVESTVDQSGTVVNGDFDAGSAQELGTMDFGASINFNLVGNDDYEAELERLIADADSRLLNEFTLEEALNASQLPTNYNITTDATFDAGTVSVSAAQSAYTEVETILDGALNSGALDINTVFDWVIEDGLSVILGENAGGSAVLSGATTITANDVGTGEALTLAGLTDTAAGTSINFADDAATLTEAQVLTITGTGTGEFSLALTAADAITVTGVTTGSNDFAEADAIDLLDTNDTIEFDGGMATLLAANYTSVFGNGVNATAGDAITVIMPNGSPVAGTAADDTFDYTGAETAAGGTNVTDFGTGGTDTIDLIDVNAATTLTEGPTFDMGDDAVFFLSTSNAGDADGDTAAATAMSTAFNNDVDMADSFVVIADDDSSAIYQVTNTGGDSDDIVADDLTLIGTVDSVLTTANIDVA
ncbi:DUF4214 domain-containing protein [Halomonas llamarensis]|uniref:DUF4214 domain-containing protein n=1 Tax=Halomonas llamarensis TaxID=2945104 RepID=A0ABT0SPD6_9GAMM|nr:DUF4214 domain-containing protein [Halomonas llamarensis]MCL7929596.1 DUF4214 domain-containing protein [Halomonas llamarensis]